MLYNIGYAVSNKYTPLLAVSIASLLKNCKDDDVINLYVLHAIKHKTIDNKAAYLKKKFI